MEKYIDKFENRIPAFLEIPWIKENILDMLGGKATSMDIYRWRSSIYYPPVDMLVMLSAITRQPTSYLLGQTDILKEAEKTEMSPRDIKKILKKRGMSVADLAAKAGTTSATMRDLLLKFPNIRTNSLIAVAEALDVSTDYLLGLSSHTRWEDEHPFANVSPGTPAYIEKEEEEVGIYCLLGNDGKTVYMPDGTCCDKDELKWRHVVQVGLQLSKEASYDE